MPIIAGSGPRPPIVPGESRHWQYDQGFWIDPVGDTLALTQAELNWFLAGKVGGLGSMPISQVTDKHPRGGSTLRSARAEARIITLPLFVGGDGSHPGWLDMWHDLEDRFSRTTEEGPGTLVLRRPDGTERRIDGYYQGGFEEGEGDGNWTWAIAPIQIWCPKPWFYDPVSVKITREYDASTGASFLDPFGTVTSSKTLGSSVLTNPGQVTAYPTWRITGPFTSFVATNVRTGELFTITPGSAVGAGDVWTITTDPPTITDEAGDPALDTLTMPGSVLWGLLRGDNPVTFAVAGAGSGTKVELEFLKRYKIA